MDLYIAFAAVILIISLAFLVISLYGSIERYSSRTVILSIFFLIFSLKYIFIIYYLYNGLEVPDYLQYVPDLLILITLIALLASR